MATQSLVIVIGGANGAGKSTAAARFLPEESIRRRYEAGIKNFFHLDRPLADQWEVHDNIRLAGFRTIAEGRHGEAAEIHDPITWELMRERGNDA